MIKNLVFDMGRVLIDYDPDAILLSQGVSDPGERKLLTEVIASSPLWALMDWGHIDEIELEKQVLPKLPQHLHHAAHQYISHWNERLIVIDGMAELIGRYHGMGYRIFLLSNASSRANDYFHTIPGNEYFSGTLFSADVKMVKPMPAIYEAFLEKFSLQAKECVFIDDLPANIAGGMTVGMQGIVFRGDTAALQKELDSLLGLI